MSEGAYFGDSNNVARKIKKIYVGVNDTARRVLKGYVGVNGVAKQFFTFYKFKSFSVSSVEYFRYCGITNTTNYVVRAGGHNTSNVMATNTEWYGNTGTKTTGSALNTKRMLMSACSFGGKAVFGGGVTSATGSWSNYCSSVVEYFDDSKARTTVTSLTSTRARPRAYANSTSMLVCGGERGSYYSTVESYSTSFSRTTLTSMSAARTCHFIGKVSENIIVGGGLSTSSVVEKTVDYYDGNGTKSTLSDLPEARASSSYVTTKDNFIIAGGSPSSKSSTSTATKTVYVYDSNLVRTTASDLADNMMCRSGGTIGGDYAVFPAGTFVDIYRNSTLVKETTTNLTGDSYEWGGYGANCGNIGNVMITSNGLPANPYANAITLN